MRCSFRIAVFSRAGCAQRVQTASPEGGELCFRAVPEVAYVGGAIHTQDDRRPLAESLLARGGRIVAVGTTDEVLAEARPGVETVDLAGRVVIPGFVDAHCHLELTATHLAYA